MIEHILEYLEAVQALSESFGLSIELDPSGESLVLVRADDSSRVVVYLNDDKLVLDDGRADIVEHELANLVGVTGED